MAKKKTKTKDKMIGSRLGNIQILSKLGAGGMGAVYKGLNTLTNSFVAVKVLLNQTYDNERMEEQMRDRFLREIKMAAKIKHPNVVPVLDAGMDKGIVYLVMEIVDGYSLGEAIDKRGKIDHKITREICISMMKGLIDIHKHDIIHRDIKPDNILLGKKNQVKITDMGLAKQQNDTSFKRLTVTGMIVGTPYYLAPEAVKNCNDASSKTDIYAIGATIYHMLTGEAPFDADSAYEIMRKHLEERVRPANELVSDVPEYMVQLIEWCMEKDDKKRPTGEQVLFVLENRVLSNKKNGILKIISAAIILILFIALISWRLIKPEVANVIVIPEDKKLTIKVPSILKNTLVRIDDEEWVKVKNNTIETTKGEHHLEFKTYREGVLYHARQSIKSDKKEETIRTTMSRVKIEGGLQMIDIKLKPGFNCFFSGANQGTETEIPFKYAGIYNISAWDGTNTFQKVLDLKPTGKYKEEEWVPTPTNYPTKKSYLKTTLDENNKKIECQAHHIMSWWEVNKIIEQKKIILGGEWQEQGIFPEQAAFDMDYETVRAIRDAKAPYGLSLPNYKTATEFSKILNKGIWYSNGDNVAPFNPNNNKAVLLLISK